MNYRCLTVLLLLVFGSVSYAQKIKTVEGSYTYIVPENKTLEEAKITAIERAKIEALANEFNTIVSQTNHTIITNEDTRTKSSFYSLGSSDVRGEWLKTIKSDITEQMTDGHLLIKAWVKGEAREITFARANFEAHLLRNNKDSESESEVFHDGDKFYISFISPSNGYLAIYLLDADCNATRIVPFQNEELCSVDRRKKYVFVDDPQNFIFLTTNRLQEINQVYVIFSPNKFYPEVDLIKSDNSSLTHYQHYGYVNNHLPYIPFEIFQKWIDGLRKKDLEAQVVKKYIKIIGKEKH